MIFRAGLLKGVPSSDHLVYEIEVINNAGSVREFVYVDAISGKVVDQITGIHDALDRRAFDAQGAAHPGPNYPNNPFWIEGDALPTADIEANNMIYASAETYDFFANAFGRDSFDDSGATMDAIFNRGDQCPNASWSGTYISFCPGLTSDDITAHEWSHAYTQYTNNLIYQWQSGALNEAYSDIWGETVDLINNRDEISAPVTLRTNGSCSIYGSGNPSNDDSVRWLMGEDSTGFNGAIRDMWDPTCYGDPGRSH
ncbi:M4 family metallopeptidase [Paraglaciecola aquimarina]|uniref:Neutral metalloproteinase n=1 Tax=Paraglaciecola aquimarina TaxID=1235557 RepID=A0ABU3SZS4_9ALTE|nr:M4 family metallopeptidase [Paraglaciecola aquimarina]MDU0355422.1 M4 family metallopeptidase [Paraglaciecola aquimarina]